MSVVPPPASFVPAGMMPLAVTRNVIAGDIDRLAADPARFLDEIIDAVPDLPDRFHRFGTVTVSQGAKCEVVPRHFWARGQRRYRLRLKPSDAAPISIHLHDVPMGGGSKGAKSILSTVAAIALLAVGTFITMGGASLAIGGATLFGAGSASAQALAAGVTFVGRLALTMAAKPAGKNAADNSNAALGQASLSANVVQPGQPFDYVAGRARLFPKMASYPLVSLEGNDEVVEACYMFEGPHQLTDARAEGTPLGEIDGLTVLMEDGTATAPPRLLQRYGWQQTVQIELKAHERDKTTPGLLANQASPSRSLPKPSIVTSKFDPDEIWLQYLWPTNFGNSAGGTAVVMPLRLKLRSGAGDWINLPELMFHSNTTGRMSKQVILKWAAVPPTITDVPLTNGAWESFHTVPPPANLGTLSFDDDGWTAHASFVGGANKNATARVERRADGFVIYLDPTVFPRGQRWQVWQMRGCLSRVTAWGASSTAFVPATYQPGGYTFFGRHTYGTAQHWTANYNAFYSNAIVESCVLMRVASVWNRPPLPKPGNAAIELRGRNINVAQLSVEAAALVKVWDGAGFSGLAPSDNPADHYFSIATGPQGAKPLDPALVNLPVLGQWHGENSAADRKVSLVLSGREWGEALDTVAAAGLARRQHGRLLSVTRQRNTAALAIPPRQVFTHLNTLSFTWTKSFAPVPDAVRVNFRNRAMNFDADWRLVIRPGLSAAEVKNIVVMESESIADAAQLEDFWRLYLSAAHHRDVLWTLDTWFEGLDAEPGDIVAVNHLSLSETHASARITAVERDGLGDITAITVDAPQTPNEEEGLFDVTSMLGLASLFGQGIALGAKIMTAGGITTQPLAAIDATAKRLVFEAPFFNDAVKEEQLVAIGRRGSETLRFEVTDVAPAGDRFFSLTLAPETPEMWEGL